VLGIGLSTWGGQIRERDGNAGATSRAGNGYVAAVLLAVLCGVMAPMLNYSFVFGQDIARQAIHLGNPALRAGYAVWPIGLAGGFLPNVGYSLYLLGKNRTWKLYQAPSPDAFWPILMGVLWMGAFAIYGMSAVYLGPLGTSIGWGLFQIFMIMTATLSGLLTGEWKGAPGKARLLLTLGIVCLSAATGLLAMGNR
jgi:L-rhamnose-H+ transport protein